VAPIVVDGLEDALALASCGRSVVLIVDEHAGPLALERAGPGRIAIFVGPADDPATWQGAEEMAKELFGA
jgi:hypothetical protein